MRGWRLLGLIGVVMLTGCARREISADYDPSTNFSGLKSFNWLHEEQPKTGNERLDSQILNNRIRNAFEQQLVAQSFEKTNSTAPDFWLRYHITLQQKTDITTFGNYDGYMWSRPYSRAVGPAPYYHSPYTRTDTLVTYYEEGTLVLDVISTNSKELLWRGTAQAEVKQTASPQKREERARKAAKNMLAHFPPKKG